MKKSKIVILGAGESGVGTAVLALYKGFDVFVSDKGMIAPHYKRILDEKNIAWEEGKHTEDKILSADTVVKSPGIPDNNPLIQVIINKGIPVLSEIEFAGKYTSAKMICITGSNGKTTTTLLIYELLKSFGFNVGLGGNVGKSFAMQVAENNFDYYVLELSSFQLDNTYTFKADVAVLLNITPDHLDRYDYDFSKYIDSKFRILQNMTSSDHFVCCADDEVIAEQLSLREIVPQVHLFSLNRKTENGAYLNAKEIVVEILKTEKFAMSTDELSIKGRHNTGNSMAAAISAKVLGVKNEIIRQSLSSFMGVEHRMELLPYKVRGVRFINDSKATNVNSVWYALESISDPIVWIVGGTDKGNDYTELFPLVKDKVKAIICLGVDNSKLLNTFSEMCPILLETNSMEKAVQLAYDNASKGDVVLLSPACASFDLFINYEDRGIKFKEAVRSL